MGQLKAKLLWVSCTQVLGLLVTSGLAASPYTEYRLETACHQYGDKRELPLLNRPHIFYFNSTVAKEFKCHLELEQRTDQDGFAIFIESMLFDGGPTCETDYLQFGIDKLFITTQKSRKFCGRIEEPTPLYNEDDLPDGLNFYSSSLSSRVYQEEGDDEIDLWIKLGPGYKQLKLVVTPYKKNCAEANPNYKQCPGTSVCIRSELFCDGRVNCVLSPLDENQLHCNLAPGGFSDSVLGIPLIIIIVVASIIAIIFIIFVVKKASQKVCSNRSQRTPIRQPDSTPRDRPNGSTLLLVAAGCPDPEAAAGGGGVVTALPAGRSPGAATSAAPAAAVMVVHPTAPPPYCELAEYGDDEPPPYSELDLRNKL